MGGFFSRVSARLRGEDAAPARPAQDVDASFAAAMTEYRAGRLPAAASGLRSVLDIQPEHFDALHMMGVVLHQSGDSEAAADCLQRALGRQPDDVAALNNLGLVLLSLRRFAEAESALRRVTLLKPDGDRAWNNLGVVLQAQARHAEAGTCFAQALALNPANVDALVNRANLAKDAGDHASAEEGYRRALAVDDHRVEAWVGLGQVLHAIGRPDAAAPCFARVLDLRPDSAAGLNGMGLVHRAQGDMAAAERSFRRACEVDRSQVEALCNLARVLNADARWEEAEHCGQHAASVRPDSLDAWRVTAAAQRASGRVHEAEASLRRALALAPESAAVQYEIATLQLLRNDYPQGFALFEHRFDAAARTAWAASSRATLLNDGRRWRGADLAGARILVWSEQGFGDTLMAMRFLPLLKGRGAGEVLFACERPLVRLAERVDGVDLVVRDDALPEPGRFDCHVPAMSLPLLFGATHDAIPGKVPYLRVPPSGAEAMRARLGETGKLGVGLAWAGSTTLQDDARRSIPLATFAPVLTLPHVRAVSLQKGPGSAQAAAWPGVDTDAIDGCQDFLDTAALVLALDLVISVDTAVAHLAGALGVPVWLLNRSESEWRWGLEGESSAWYPTMRIFRQGRGEPWSGVLGRVVVALQGHRPPAPACTASNSVVPPNEDRESG